MGWSRKCEKRGKHWLRAAALGVVFLWTAGSSLQAEAESSKSAHWHKGVGVEAWLTGADKEQVSQNAASQNDAADTAITAVGGQGTDVASDSADSKTKASSGDGTKMDDLTGTIVMTSVQNVLNVRTEPDSEAELAGYLYADCGGTVLEQKDGWTKLESGELTGWANNDYLLFGEEARKEAKDAGRIVATTKTGALRIRKEPSADAAIYDLLEEGAKYEVVDEEQIRFSEDQEITADWVAINYGGKTGYVSSEYVQVDFEIDYGETVEQVKAREEADRLDALSQVERSRQAACRRHRKRWREAPRLERQRILDGQEAGKVL